MNGYRHADPPHARALQPARQSSRRHFLILAQAILVLAQAILAASRLTTGPSGTPHAHAHPATDSTAPRANAHPATDSTAPRADAHPATDSTTSHADDQPAPATDPNLAVIATIRVGSYPTSILANPETNRIYVANTFGDSISVIDGASQQVIKTIPVPAGPGFTMTSFDTRRNELWVSHNGSSRVSIIDLGSDTLVGTVAIPGSAPESVAVFPERGQAYVSHSATRMSVIDVARRQVVGEIQTTGSNHVIVVNPAMDQALVSLSAPQRLSVVDLRLGQEEALLDIHGHVALDLDIQRGYALAFDDGMLTAFDAQALTKLASIPFGPQGTNWGQPAVNPNTHCVYAPLYSRDALAVVDGVNLEEVGRVGLGASPANVAVNPATGLVYVTNKDEGTVSIVRDGVCRHTRIPRPTSETPLAQRAYLPLLQTTRSCPDGQPLDLVFLVDASTSMRDLARPGQTKLDVEKAAIRDLIRAVYDNSPAPQGVRMSLVSFNAEPTVLQPLTSNPQKLLTALDRIRTAQFTRLDDGLRAAARELTRTASTGGRTRVILAMTDGMVNPTGPHEAIQAADDVRRQGPEIWVLGIGPLREDYTLARVAGSADRYWPAPEPAALASIAQVLRPDLHCP